MHGEQPRRVRRRSWRCRTAPRPPCLRSAPPSLPAASPPPRHPRRLRCRGLCRRRRRDPRPASGYLDLTAPRGGAACLVPSSAAARRAPAPRAAALRRLTDGDIIARQFGRVCREGLIPAPRLAVRLHVKHQLEPAASRSSPTCASPSMRAQHAGRQRPHHRCRRAAPSSPPSRRRAPGRAARRAARRRAPAARAAPAHRLVQRVARARRRERGGEGRPPAPARRGARRC